MHTEAHSAQTNDSLLGMLHLTPVHMSERSVKSDILDPTDIRNVRRTILKRLLFDTTNVPGNTSGKVSGLAIQVWLGLKPNYSGARSAEGISKECAQHFILICHKDPSLLWAIQQLLSRSPTMRLMLVMISPMKVLQLKTKHRNHRSKRKSPSSELPSSVKRADARDSGICAQNKDPIEAGGPVCQGAVGEKWRQPWALTADVHALYISHLPFIESSIDWKRLYVFDSTATAASVCSTRPISRHRKRRCTSQSLV